MRYIIFLLLFKTSYSQIINWQAWGNAAFNEAKTKRKPIFLDVGTEWCTACNLMEEKTYSNKEIIDLLNKNFICIKADAEAQPDVGARFLEWGWPALIFLDNNGNQLRAFQGNRQPEIFKKIIINFLKDYKSDNLKPDNTDYYVVDELLDTPINDLLIKANTQLDNYYDSLYYGWGFVLKIPLYQPIEYSFWQAKTLKNNYAQTKAINSLIKYAQISDRIGGGVYFGCTSGRNWEGAQPEKRTEYQGGVLHNYAEAYMATQDQKWLNEASLIKKYLYDNLLSKTDSLFYNSQEEYISLLDLSKTIEPEIYFNLSLEERKKYGQPPIDKTIYTDINFRIVRGLLKLFQANKDSSDLKLAISLANNIVKKAYQSNGWFKTVISNNNSNTRMRLLPSDSSQKNVIYLKPQAQAALAMLDLYQLTQNKYWLTKCIELRKIVTEKLYDEKLGGYFSTNLMPISLSNKKTSTKVLMENALFARFLIELQDLTDDKSFEKITLETLNAVGSDKILKNEERLIADYNLAVSKAIQHHLVFTVVSNDFNSKQTKKLLSLVNHYYHPQKLIKLDKPGHYPDLGEPSLFICNQNLCSQPIKLNLNTLTEMDSFINKLK
ncbi:MAG: DUF255 domain-containing protein [Bacteroidetes bacterium]|nr:DUF255 domain-containing protein [Bacteroidota bacterium]